MSVSAVALLLVALLDPAKAKCSERKIEAESCRTVHGRFRAHQGNPTFRIWIVGTTRMLALDNETDSVTAQIGERFVYGSKLYGDFQVCPLEPARKGEMQMVCLESARNLVLEMATDTKATRLKKIRDVLERP